jgi:hypothetical protein
MAIELGRAISKVDLRLTRLQEGRQAGGCGLAIATLSTPIATASIAPAARIARFRRMERTMLTSR